MWGQIWQDEHCTYMYRCFVSHTREGLGRRVDVSLSRSLPPGELHEVESWCPRLMMLTGWLMMTGSRDHGAMQKKR